MYCNSSIIPAIKAARLKWKDEARQTIECGNKLGKGSIAVLLTFFFLWWGGILSKDLYAGSTIVKHNAV